MNVSANELTEATIAPPAANAPVAGSELELVAAVREHLGMASPPSENAKYLAAQIDLDNDGDQDAVVYLIDPMLCGTGGCPLYVIARSPMGLAVQESIGPAQLPIYALGRGTDGWVDLGVSIGGGGAESAIMAVPHRQGSYATNPTVEPVKKTSSEGATLLIADDAAKAQPLPKDLPLPKD